MRSEPSFLRCIHHPYVLCAILGILLSFAILISAVLELTGVVAFPGWVCGVVICILVPTVILFHRWDKIYNRKLKEFIELSTAVNSKDINNLQAMITKGYPIRIFPFQGLLWSAVVTGDLEIVKVLLHAGVDPMETKSPFETESAFDVARKLNREDILRLFER